MEIQSNETPKEVLNWFLTRADEEIDKARNAEAVWGPSAEAVTVLEQITAARKYLDQAEAGAVAMLREEGATWTQIGTFLGVTKQAAQSRFRTARIYRLGDDPKAVAACCDHRPHQPGECTFSRATDDPGGHPVRCDCDGDSPTILHATGADPFAR